MKVKLADGRALRDPATKVPMPAGVVREVPDNPYWRRRLRDGDVVAADHPAPRRHHDKSEG